VISEQNNGHSFRLLHNKFHNEKTQAVVCGNDLPMELTILTSNTCNLLCLPCNGGGSYIRGVELRKIGLKKTIVKHFKKNSALDDVHKFDFERITFLGGEPFGDKVTFECLENLVKHQKSKNITLDLNTNGTLITREKMDFLSDNFKFVYIKASIDGIAQVNDYLRYPSKWTELQAQILMTHDYTNMSLMLTTALSNLALMRYYQVVEWAFENSIDDLFLSTVQDPQMLRSNNLPSGVKEQLLKTYMDLKTRYQNQMTERIEFVIDACISICQTQNNGNFSNTMQWLELHDQHRKNSVLNIFPELNDYCQT
jgi:sulfatase maturation enzyme AslB (radical SAM superfamily)